MNSNGSRLMCRVLGICAIAFAVYLGMHAKRALDLSQPMISNRDHQEVPKFIRVPEGVATIVLFAIPSLVFGLRMILRPVGWNEVVSRGRLVR